MSTIDRRVAAITALHRSQGHDTPTAREEVRNVLAGIRNTLGRAPRKKKALTDDLVVKVLRKIGFDLVGLRDRAMIALCFGAALRRSELVGLDVGDLEFHKHRVRCADVMDYVFEVQVRVPPGPDPALVFGQIETRLAALGDALYAIATGVPRQLAEGASVIFDAKGKPLVTAVAVASPPADLPAMPLGAYRCRGVSVSSMAG